MDLKVIRLEDDLTELIRQAPEIRLEVPVVLIFHLFSAMILCRNLPEVLNAEALHIMLQKKVKMRRII